MLTVVTQYTAKDAQIL